MCDRNLIIMSPNDTPHLPETSSRIYKVKLGEKPCAVKYVEQFGGFVVGTYDCLPDIESASARFPSLSESEVSKLFEATNHRIGSLNFISKSPPCPINSENEVAPYKLQVVHQCEHGGIFDMSITPSNQIYAAHANGYIARYSFDNVAFESLESLKVTSSDGVLLTSLDTCSKSSRQDELEECFFSIVGDSHGQVTLVRGYNLEEVVAKCDITADGDPVWQVRFVPNSTGNDISQIVVAAEDSSWYIYTLNLRDGTVGERFQQLYRNQDFTAGVTSICFLPALSQTNQDDGCGLLLGSYDESIRHYKLKSGNSSSSGNLKSEVDVESTLNLPIVIKGGGIWRQNHVAADGRLYIAAMYAGSYRLDLSSLYAAETASKAAPESQSSQTIVCDKIIELDAEGDSALAPLHYGIDLAPRDSQACIVDYNNNLCIFVKLDQCHHVV